MRTSVALALIAGCGIAGFALHNVTGATNGASSSPAPVATVSVTVTPSPSVKLPNALVTCDSFEDSTIEIDGSTYRVPCKSGPGTYLLTMDRWGQLQAGSLWNNG